MSGKHVLYSLLILIVAPGLTSCSAITPGLSPTDTLAPALTLTQTSTPTSTLTPTPTLTPTATWTPTPTVSLPVTFLTPVPLSKQKISRENITAIQEIARYYGFTRYSAKITIDNRFLFVLDPDGLTKYEYEAMRPILHILLPNSGSNLQISNDGHWVLVDDKLVDLRNESEPKIHVLPEVLKTGGDYFLSLDGSMIAVQWTGCLDLCEYKLRIASTEDLRILHSEQGFALRSAFAFSPDGRFFAVAFLLQTTTPGGGTGVIGGAISVRETSKFAIIRNINMKFPFYVYSLAISEDNKWLAAAKESSIHIFDMKSGEEKITLVNLCRADWRTIRFAPGSMELLENSSCSNNAWEITEQGTIALGGGVPDFSHITFDEQGSFKNIPFPLPIDPEISSSIDNLVFLDNTTLFFRSRGYEDKLCKLDLQSNSVACEVEASWEKGKILATDGVVYEYVVRRPFVDFLSPETPDLVYDSIPFNQMIFVLDALDTINRLAFYGKWLTPNFAHSVIYDMEKDRVVYKWENAYIKSIAIAKQANYAALCLFFGNSNWPNKDKLVIVDLVNKKIVYSQTFTCHGAKVALSSDGNRVAVQYHYLRNPTDALYSTKAMILETGSPYNSKKRTDDLATGPHGIAFLPDDSAFAVVCNENQICFFDVTTLDKIHQIRAHSHIDSLAFSPDGKYLATLSAWGLISLWAVPPFDYPNRPSTANLPALDKTLEFLNNVQVVYIDTFDDPNQDGWNLDAGTIKNGILEVVGKNWNGLTRRNKFKEGMGIVLDFTYTKGSVFEVYVDSGTWDTDTYKRFGVYVDNNQPRANLWVGSNPLEGALLSSNLALKPDTNYMLLIAILPDGDFLAVIWDPFDPTKTILYHEKIGKNWSGLTWRFAIGADSGTILFDNYREIKFDSVK